MSSDLVSFIITTNGTPIASDLQVLAIGIEQHADESFASIEIAVNDFEGLPIELSPGFTIGSAIEIRVGYNEQNQTAFRGIVTDKGARLSRELGAKCIFLCESDDEAPINNTTLNVSPDYTFAVDLGCDADNVPSGSLQVQGTLQYNAGNDVNLGDVIVGFPVGTIASVIHEISEGNWLTTLVFPAVI